MAPTRYALDRASLDRETRIDLFRGSGPGGQHRNRRETAVRLTHLPSGVVVTATERRSQLQNIELAYERLAQRLAELQRVKKRRRATRPTRGSQRRRVEGKKKRGQTKSLRRKPTE